MRELGTQNTGGAAFERAHHLCRGIGWADPHKQVNVIGHDFVCHDLPAMLGGDLLQEFVESTRDPPTKHTPTIFRTPDDMQPKRTHPTGCALKPGR